MSNLVGFRKVRCDVIFFFFFLDFPVRLQGLKLDLGAPVQQFRIKKKVVVFFLNHINTLIIMILIMRTNTNTKQRRESYFKRNLTKKDIDFSPLRAEERQTSDQLLLRYCDLLSSLDHRRICLRLNYF